MENINNDKKIELLEFVKYKTLDEIILGSYKITRTASLYNTRSLDNTLSIISDNIMYNHSQNVVHISFIFKNTIIGSLAYNVI